MSEELPQNHIETPKIVETKTDTGGVEIPVVAQENPEQKLGELEKQAEAVFETDYKKALDISIVRQKLAEAPDGKYEVALTLHGKNNEGRERDEEFTIAYAIDKHYLNFDIISAANGEVGSGTYSNDRYGKCILGLGVDMGDLMGFGYYSQIMEGLLQGVDVTENAIRNEEALEVYRKYSVGDYVVPSVFAARSQLVAVRKGFLCFIHTSSARGNEGLSFVGVRVADELKEILEKAKQWERGNGDLDLEAEAAKIKSYIQKIEGNQEILAQNWGVYWRECMDLLKLQIERFEDMAKGIDRYPPREAKAPSSLPLPKNWIARLRERLGI